MMEKASVFVATSIDSFIARKNGSIDWLDQANALVPSGENACFSDFMNSFDALVMGRNTFEQILSFNNWPYGTRTMVVLSSKSLDIPFSLRGSVSSSSESLIELLSRLARNGLKHKYIDSGLTI